MTTPSVGRYLDVQGVRVPTFLYGTAWKEERTETLAAMALLEGFRGVDTANQRKHYFEEGVGRAVARALEQGLVHREDLFLQTKFTHRAGQDHRLPYDPSAQPGEQVTQSFESSCAHLQVEYVDAYLIHGPSSRYGLPDSDLQVWRAMESLHDAGRVHLLGISNVDATQLQTLWTRARVKPAFVQNRCYASTGWDADVRQVCRAHGIVYQAFSLLTANVHHFRHPDFQRLAQRLQRSPAQIVFRAALQLGMIPLTGTASAEHMQEDLAVYDFELSQADVAMIESIA